jgi:hypothetical protein
MLRIQNPHPSQKREGLRHLKNQIHFKGCATRITMEIPARWNFALLPQASYVIHLRVIKL